MNPAWVYYYDEAEDPCPAGGWSWLASESFIRKGAVLESCNPYDPSALRCDGACAGCDACPPVKPVNGYRFVTGDQGDTNLVKQAVYEHGPTTMAFFWSSDHVYSDTQRYGTVFDYAACPEEVGHANHLVSIIGWDDDVPHYETPGTGAWLVKNSWGTAWGNDGTFWLAYDSSCMTEIAYVTYEDHEPGVELLYWDEAGFVGSHVVDHLIDAGAEVTVIDDLSGGYSENVNSRACFIQKDVNELQPHNLRGAQVIYHLAAHPAEGLSVFMPYQNTYNNYLSSLKLLALAIILSIDGCKTMLEETYFALEPIQIIGMIFAPYIILKFVFGRIFR